MKKNLIPILAFASVALLLMAIVRGDDAPQPFQRDAKKVPAWCVQVKRQIDARTMDNGSGVIVSPDGWILTAKHVVADAQAVKIVLTDGKSVTGQVVKRGLKPGFDVAAVKIETKVELPCVPLAWGLPEEGETVQSWGYPDGFGNSHSSKVVGRHAGYDPETDVLAPNVEPQPEWLSVDRPFVEGISGGPVLNSSGELVGLCSARYPVDQSGVAVGVRECARVLFAARAKTVIRRPRGFLFFSLRPQLWVIHSAPCAPCEKFDNCYGSNSRFRKFLDERWRVHFLDGRRAKRWSERMKITAFPAFVFSNSKTIIFGFESEEAFINELVGEQSKDPPAIKNTCRVEDIPDLDEQVCEMSTSPNLRCELTSGEAVSQVNWNYPAPPQPVVPVEVPQARSPPQPVFAPPPLAPAPAPVPDPNQVAGDQLGLCRAVWLVPQLSLIPQFLGGAVGKLESLAAHSALRNRLSAATSGKLQVDIVLQRVEPARFAAVAKSAECDPKYGGLVLICPQSFSGLVGSAAGAVERLLEGVSVLKALPISEVFERTNKARYETVVADLARDYSESGDNPIGPGGYSGGILAILFYHVSRYLRGGKSQEVTA